MLVRFPSCAYKKNHRSSFYENFLREKNRRIFSDVAKNFVSLLKPIFAEPLPASLTIIHRSMSQPTDLACDDLCSKALQQEYCGKTGVWSFSPLPPPPLPPHELCGFNLFSTLIPTIGTCTTFSYDDALTSCVDDDQGTVMVGF